jgi:hypothetical protein
MIVAVAVAGLCVPAEGFGGDDDDTPSPVDPILFIVVVPLCVPLICWILVYRQRKNNQALPGQDLGADYFNAPYGARQAYGGNAVAFGQPQQAGVSVGQAYGI